MVYLNALIASGVLLAAVGAAPSAPLFAVSGKITGGPDGGWDLAAVDDGGHRLYVARRGSVMAVDLATGKVAASVIPIKFGHGVLPIPGTTRVIATDGSTGKATLFEGATGQVVAEIPTGKNPDAIAWDPATRTVWVFNPGSGDAAVIDPASAKVVATVAIGGSLELGVADGAGRLYVNVEDKNEVVALDTGAKKVIARYPLTGCDGPTGIAYSAKAELIVSACGNGVAKLTTPDGKDAGSVKIGAHPDGAAFDEKRQLVLIPSGGDGKLTVIRLLPKPEVVETVTTQVGARTIAFDQGSETAYLPAASYAPAVGTARPQPLPGSFVIVTVKPAGAGAMSGGTTLERIVNKVPQVTIAFWIIKICATTLGETGGDELSMTMKLGYAAATGVFFAFFIVTLIAQLKSKKYNPALYWLVILSTTTAGTTMSDFLDRTAHLGYFGGSAVLVALLVAVLIAWRLTLGKITFDHVVDWKVETFYWVTILFSNTLGTALGDWMADDTGLGYQGGALVFGSGLAVIALLYFFTKVPRTALFWLAFVLTRPLGATLGDTLTKPLDHGGLNLGTLPASAALFVLVVILVAFAARRPAPTENPSPG